MSKPAGSLQNVKCLTSHLLIAGIGILFAVQVCLAQARPPKAAPKTQPIPSSPVAQKPELWLSVFPVGEKIYGLYNDVQDPKTFYACTHRGLFKTPNAGLTWTSIFATDAQSLTLAQSKSSPNVMYLGGSKGNRGGIFKTSDGGTTWQRIAPQDIQGMIQSVQVDPRNPDLVYVFANQYLYKSMNGGRTWGNVSPIVTGNSGQAMALLTFFAMDPVNSGHLFADQWETTDGGASWQVMSSVVSVYHNGPSSQIDKAGEWQLRWFHPTDTNSRVALVNIQGWEPPHLVISRDAGQSWKDRSIVNAKERANPDSDRPHTRSFGWSMKSPGSIYVGAGNSLYASTDYGQRWTSILPSLTSAVVAPPSGDVYAATALGVVKTRNDGRNWHLANLGLPNASAGDSNLFQAVQVQGQNIYVGARGGFWNSPDGGLTWNWISSDSALSNEIVSQLFVLRDDTKVFLQGNFTNDYGVIHVGRDSNILKLQPDGKLVKIRTGKSPSMIGMSPSDPATIYMAAGGSVLKSDDSGFSWETFDFTQGLRPAVASTPIVQVPLFAVASQSSKIVYVAVVLQKPFDAARNYALMQTLDGGATWRDVFPAKLMPTGFNYGALGDISGVAIDPRDSRTVYLAFNSGVYRSGDGGATWTQLPAKAGKINGITVSAQSSQVLYLATETGVWVSRNGGATWALGNVGPLQENVKTIVSGSELTLSQGSNGIYRLTSDLSWASSKWKECEEKPELGPISSTGPAVVISY